MSVSIVDKSTGDLIKVAGRSGLQDASQTSYDNTSSGMTADDVQEAIDELHTSLSGKQDTLTFDDVPTDNSNNPVKSNGVYDALAAKQNATDNNLQTTAKTVVGGINELDDAVSDLEDWTDGDTKTVTGNPIVITDGSGSNATALSMSIEPKQDLHGYSKPWAGGAGKNLIPMTVDGIKAANSGTWDGNTLTKYDVTYTILTDNDNNVIGIKANGTASANAELNLVTNNTWFPGANTYTLTGGVSNGVRIFYYDGTSYKDCKPNPVSFTLTGSETVSRCTAVVASGSTANNDIFYPMIRVSTETDASFAPYTNICPISGHTEASVERVGKNLFDPKLMVSPTDTAKFVQIELLPNTTYTVSSNVPNSIISAYIFAIAGTDTSGVTSGNNGVGSGRNQTITTGQDGIISFGYRTNGASGQINLSEYNYQIELGSTATPYEPYNSATATINFGQTVYGGTVDFNTGKVISTYRIIDENAEWSSVSSATSSGGLRWTNFDSSTVKLSGNAASNMIYTDSENAWYSTVPCLQVGDSTARLRIYTDVTDITQFKSKYAGLQVCYELANPITLYLTPTQLRLLKGNNTITANGAVISLTYQPESVLGEAMAYTDQRVEEATKYNTQDLTTTSRTKNIAPWTLDNLKYYNTSGTWTDNVYVYEGITYTVNTDNDGNISSIGVDGTATSTYSHLTVQGNIKAGSYKLNGAPTGDDYYLQLYKSPNVDIKCKGSDTDAVLASDVSNLRYRIIVMGGATANNLTYYPMLRLATASANYAPYIPSVNARIANLVRTKEVTIATGTTQYDGYYYGTETHGISGKIISAYIKGTGSNHAAFLNYCNDTTIRVCSPVSGTNVTVIVAYI